MSQDTPSVATARALAAHMQVHGGAFHDELDELFQVAILADALHRHGIRVRHCRSNFTEEGQWPTTVVNFLLIDDQFIGIAGQRSLRECEPPATVDDPGQARRCTWSTADELVDALVQYSKPGTDLRQSLFTLSDAALAFLQSRDLQHATQSACTSSCGPRSPRL